MARNTILRETSHIDPLILYLLEIISYNPILERVGVSNGYISHEQSSSHKVFFEIELEPLNFNIVSKPSSNNLNM
jgi:hypothetical protein